MFEQCGHSEETIFVDRPSHIFKHVLSFATDPLYPYPEKYKFELDFYRIEYSNLNLYNNEKTISVELCEIKKKIENLFVQCKQSGCNELIFSTKSYCEEHEECYNWYDLRKTNSLYCSKCKT
jgi:hypothetical protein